MAHVRRLLAIIALPAHTVDAIWSRLLPALRRVPASLLIVALLVFAAVQEIERADAADAARPQPVESSVAALVEARGQFWVSVTALISGPLADSDIYQEGRSVHYRPIDEPHDRQGRGFGEQAPPAFLDIPQGDGVLRHLYVLRDPADPSKALVALSSSADEAVAAGAGPVQVTGVMAAHRTRMEVILDEQAVAAALAGTSHSDERYLALGAGVSFRDETYEGAVAPALAAAMLFISWLAARLSRPMAPSAGPYDAVAAGW
ncbi:MAG: hypothetical protein H0X60_06640 [Chloroflexi bacterium]|nr:hypothetical protein [Chloroflexota bacterium]